MTKLRTRIANMFVNPILRSRLHGMVSRSVMLIEFTGRKTGKAYRFPVGYAFGENHTVRVFSRKDRTWWRNLRDGRAVTLWIRRHKVKATAIEFVEDDPDTLLPLMREMYSTLSEDDRQEMLPDMVLIRLKVPDMDWNTTWDPIEDDNDEDDEEAEEGEETDEDTD